MTQVERQEACGSIMRHDTRLVRVDRFHVFWRSVHFAGRVHFFIDKECQVDKH